MVKKTMLTRNRFFFFFDMRGLLTDNRLSIYCIRKVFHGGSKYRYIVWFTVLCHTKCQSFKLLVAG